MKCEGWKRWLLPILAVMLLSVNAGALFGRQTAEMAETNLPLAEDVTCLTYQGVACWGELKGTDSGGGEVSYSLVKGPARGSVQLEGHRFVYTPKPNAMGTDWFTYTATNGAGETSAPATVRISLQRNRSGVSYEDMAGHVAAAAAQHLAEEGIFTGVKLGDRYYFEPEREVLRSEFLVMALETMERKVTDVTITGFCDDETIPVWAKAYAAAGVAEGVVEGSVTPQGNAFRGQDAIAFNEAATMLNRMLGLGDVDLQAVYGAEEDMPSWAAQAVANLESVQVLEAGSFGSGAMEMPITRADAARMLSAVRLLTKR